jgi:hypothetical protein
MRIDSSGNVGIGTTTMTGKFNVVGGDLAIQEEVAGRAIGFATNNKFTSPEGNSVAYYGMTWGSSESASVGFSAFNSVVFYNQGVERGRFDASVNLKFNSGYGSVATAYGCRAWVNFNGTGTPAIRASGNISSITDLGTGSYRLNFSTAMPDANYSVVGSSTSVVGISATFVCTTFRRDTDTRVDNTTTTTTFSTVSDTSNALDTVDVNVSVFR